MTFPSYFAILAIALSFSPLARASEPAAAPAAPAAAQTWQAVENEKVCMVTDMVFPRKQIPVTVGDKTYYGCCANCKDRLAQDESVRFGVDPVSGKKVDKATAAIAAGPDGSVAYFENKANLQSFVSRQK